MQSLGGRAVFMMQQKWVIADGHVRHSQTQSRKVSI